jgi:hypothetical protein
MSRFFAYDPDQAYLLPPNVKDVLGNEHLCFRLHQMVEQLEGAGLRKGMRRRGGWRIRRG